MVAAICSLSCGRSSRGRVLETWETGNNAFKVRITAYAEKNGGFVAGAYYVFQSAQSGANAWHEIMTFRHDDPVRIPREQVRFVQDKIGYAFMGWMYAVTTDEGRTWIVWDATKDLPNWTYRNYGLIRDMSIRLDGSGTMTLDPIPARQGEAPMLCTKDYGRHWTGVCG
jgi:hypothetical protein